MVGFTFSKAIEKKWKVLHFRECIVVMDSISNLQSGVFELHYVKEFGSHNFFCATDNVVLFEPMSGTVSIDGQI